MLSSGVVQSSVGAEGPKGVGARGVKGVGAEGGGLKPGKGTGEGAGADTLHNVEEKMRATNGGDDGGALSEHFVRWLHLCVSVAVLKEVFIYEEMFEI
ncbi:hypothetical protein GH714_010741 [Hevea brasiliensis]|uniref:Uncharacterized protein n=1 Tax=Hevea brasiliensis TaxID=3981 RepID=A0A6A6N7Z9_HEVBR|nr:hypothetical protein GH714_010741 [Hevea brasiliensis]